MGKLMRALVLLALAPIVAGTSCSTNGGAEPENQQAEGPRPSGKPMMIEAWLVEATAPVVSISAEAIRAAAEGDSSALLAGVEGPDLGARLRAAEERGMLQILQSPTILTRLDESFVFRSGLQIPVQTMAGDAVVVQYVDATLNLRGRASLDADGTINLDINVKKQVPRFDLAEYSRPNASIQTTDATALLIVRDGGTAVISGLHRIRGLAQTRAETPDTARGHELLLFLTATLAEL
jgi:type II secretory pathway component HofQ